MLIVRFEFLTQLSFLYTLLSDCTTLNATMHSNASVCPNMTGATNLSNITINNSELPKAPTQLGQALREGSSPNALAIRPNLGRLTEEFTPRILTHYTLRIFR